MKVIGIVKNNGITGVEYGLIEIAEPKATPTKKKFKSNTKKTKNNEKHVSSKNTRAKKGNIEKETKVAAKTSKRRYHLHATIVCSYYTKPSKKRVNLNKKYRQKNLTLFKKKQRKGKIAAQNMMLAKNFIEPILKTLEQQIQKTR